MKRKNQWKITDIHTNKVSYFLVGPENNKRSKSRLGIIIRGSLTVLISVLIIYGVMQANTTTFTPPSGEPSARFYTLTDIYNRLNDNSTASEHLFTFADPLSGARYTLTEIYNKIPTIDPSKLLDDDTTYLGITGTFNVSNLLDSVIKKDITWGVNLGSTGTYIPTYTWIKESNSTPTWNGVNEDLDWAKEIGGTAWWDGIAYNYRQNDGTQETKTTADYTAPPGGWNGSSDDDGNTVYSNHDNQALHLYRVIFSDDYNLGTCTSGEVDKGDLVFPDDSVWDKSDTKTYGVKIDCGTNAWEDAPDGTPKDKEQDGALADDSSVQLNNARNAPSVLAIADAWDGIKNLVSCPEDNSYNYYQWSGTPSSGNDWYDNGYQEDGKKNDYYDRPAESWYKDWGSGAGTSRLPMIEEYGRAKQGTSNAATSLLYGTTNCLWSAEQSPSIINNARYFVFSASEHLALPVHYQVCGMWVVVAQ